MQRLNNRFTSVSELNDFDIVNNPLRRSYSDTNINHTEENGEENVEESAVSTLELNSSRVNVGEKIIVTWNLAQTPTENDRLALCYENETSIDNQITSKKKSIGKAQTGQISWLVHKDTQFKEDFNTCVFKYFHGLLTESQSCVATSAAFTICRPLSMCPAEGTMPMAIPGVDDLLIISISGVKATNLKKNFFGKPKPSVRINIVPRVRHLAAFQKHHGLQGKTSSVNNTVNPKWDDEFVFSATAADLLEIEVDNKSKVRTPDKKFLGKLVFPVSKIIESCGLDTSRRITQHLLPRTPADKVQGTFSFAICIKKSPLKAEYTFPQLSKRISASNVSADSTLPLPDGPRNSILTSNGSPKLRFDSKSEKPRPHSYHPSALERTFSSQCNSVSLSRSQEEPIHIIRSTSVPEENEEEEDELSPADNATPTTNGAEDSDSECNENGQDSSETDPKYAELVPEELVNETTTATEEDPNMKSLVASYNGLNLRKSGYSSELTNSSHLHGDEKEAASTTTCSFTVEENTTPANITYEKISNSRFYVKRNSENENEPPPRDKESSSSLLDKAFCEPNTSVNGSLISDNNDSTVVNGHADNGNEGDIEDTIDENENVTAPSTSAIAEEETNDDDEEGYTQVEPEFSQNDDGSCDSNEYDENNRENRPVSTTSSNDIFRVNSCQNLLGDDCESSDTDVNIEPSISQNSSKHNKHNVDVTVVKSSGMVPLMSPIQNSCNADIKIPIDTTAPTVSKATTCVSNQSNAITFSPGNSGRSTSPHYLTNQNVNLIDLSDTSCTPVSEKKPGSGYTVHYNSTVSSASNTGASCSTTNSVVSSPSNVLDFNFLPLEKDKNTFSVNKVSSPASGPISPPLPPKPSNLYPGGARPREPKTPKSLNSSVSSTDPNNSNKWTVSLDSTSTTTSPITTSNLDLGVNESASNSRQVSISNGYSHTSSISELNDSLFTLPLFTSSDIRLPPPRGKEDLSFGGIVNSSFVNSPKASPVLNNKDMPLARTDYDSSTYKAPPPGNKINLANIIKNEFPPFTITSNSTKVCNEDSPSLYSKSVTSPISDIIDSTPRTEVLPVTSNSTPSSSNSSPMGREFRRSTRTKKTKSRTTSSVEAPSSGDNVRTPSSVPDMPPPLPPKDAPRVLDIGESIGVQNSASGSKSSSSADGFRQRPSRTYQPDDIINEVLSKGVNRSQGKRESMRTRHTPKQMERSESSSHSSRSSDDRLPKNWEKAIDSHGRVYYIDHNNKTTTWHRPKLGAPTSPEHSLNNQLEQLDRRYQSLRRTLRASRRPTVAPEEPIPENTIAETTPTTTTPAAAAVSVSQSTPTSSDNSPNLSSPNLNDRQRAIQDSPGCQFILRRDFFQFVSNHNLASQFLHRNPNLNQIISKIRSDPQRFVKYQHSRDIVTLLNFFASDALSLPPGWEVKSDGYGQSYFVDHNLKVTTFIDPRLPLEETSSRSSRHRNQQTPTTSSQQPSQQQQNESTRSSSQSSSHTPSSSSSSSSSTPHSNNDSQTSSSTSSRRSRRNPLTTPPPPTYNTPPATSSSSSTSSSSNNKAEATSLAIPKTYDEKVVAFLRQDNITDILKKRDADYDGKTALQRKITLIQRDGVNGLKRYQSDMELVILVSMFEDEIQSYVPKSVNNETLNRTLYKESFRGSQSGRTPAPYRRDFEAKIRTFHKQLIQNEYGQGPGKIRLKIRRRHVLQEAFDQIMKQQPRSLHKEKLYIKFTGEEGLDYGGPAREFFFMISRELFNPYYGLFEYSAIDTYTLQISPASRYVENAQNWFRFAGRIVALSLIHQHLLDVFFTRTIYKALLREPWDLSDLQTLDPEYHQSLNWILENDITDTLDVCFTVNEEVFGDDKLQERELKPNGTNIVVTEENKKEYVDLMVKWKIERGQGEQMNQLIRGFSEALDLKMISLFDDRELELVLAGTADIDMKDWRKNTEYRSGYHDKHNVIQWFWKAVDSFTNERRLRLIQFVTGTSSIPYEGFGALRGSTGLKKFTIDCWGTCDMLPRAHTCFNRLDLPPYKEYDTLLEKLLYAIEETSTFGIE